MKHLFKLFLAVVGIAMLANSALAQTQKKTSSIKIEGNYLEYTTTNRVSIITGKPVMVKDIESGLQLNCEKLRVLWSTNNSGIDKAYAEGKVIITITDKDGLHTATAGHAEYDGKTDIITLTDNPVLEDSLGWLRGAEKVLYERAASKFSAVNGKIQMEVKIPTPDVKKPAAPGQEKK
ncbi:MAG TPA: LptA/OstA family protein [Verrucomicrobiae bacterium]